eukprot:CAMPEP_0206525298 /NCGR_PEP_ID=MMETSP0324_2-20121206/68654_1 /ASSEMBLY_ACC=CAM_ASM_000836 /TAXON_ID=2866 /ORGANISM="Crypthecodinium cohnii, Strain Seligo" /LENGTH=246 /DNA_ID=CAMNT_0054019945 /DNA_START=431 /DNA_END=1171 /DNA_ORIENTATION=-
MNQESAVVTSLAVLCEELASFGNPTFRCDLHKAGIFLQRPFYVVGSSAGGVEEIQARNHCDATMLAEAHSASSDVHQRQLHVLPRHGRKFPRSSHLGSVCLPRLEAGFELLVVTLHVPEKGSHRQIGEVSEDVFFRKMEVERAVVCQSRKLLQKLGVPRIRSFVDLNCDRSSQLDEIPGGNGPLGTCRQLSNPSFARLLEVFQAEPELLRHTQQDMRSFDVLAADQSTDAGLGVGDGGGMEGAALQ